GGGSRRVTGGTVHSETLAPAFHARAAKAPERRALPGATPRSTTFGQVQSGSGGALAPSRTRAQQYEADLYLRVRDLSRATKSALRVTRSLGGYVRSVHYDDGRAAGSAELVV